MDQKPTSPPSVNPPKQNSLAFTSLILGCCSLIGFCLTGIPAIILGHKAQKQIKLSNGSQTGAGLALTGLILGYLFTCLSIIPILAGLAVPQVTKAMERAEQLKEINNVKALKSTLDNYALDFDGEYPQTLDQLVERKAFDDYEIINELNGHYISGFSQPSPDELIIFYAPKTLSERYSVVQVNGSAYVVTHKELILLGKEQGFTIP